MRLFSFFFLLIFFLYFLLCVSSVVFNYYPSEFREGHTLTPTYLFMNGIKPWTLETYPVYYNSYGFIFNCVVYPFAFLFGNSLIVHRIFNELFYLLTICMILFYKMPKKIDFQNCFFFVVLFAIFNYGSNISLRPDGCGTFLYSSTFLIPFRNNLRFGYVFVSMIFAILSFFTKPYFVLGWYLLSIVILLHNWKFCLIYNFVFHSFFLISLIIVLKLFPLYYYETIFAYDSSICNVSHTTSIFPSLLYSIKQYCTFFILLIPFIFYYLVNIKKNSLRIDWRLIIPMIICSLLLFYPLGTNDGAWVTYHIQLLMPIIAIYLIHSICCDKSRSNIINILAIVLLIPIVFLGKGIYSPSNDWEKAEKYIEDNNTILNSSLIVPLMIQNNKVLTDNGVSGFVYGFKSRPFTEKLFGQDKEIEMRKNSYISDIKTNISDQKYDVIMLTDGDYMLLNMVDTMKYKNVDCLNLNTYFSNRKMYVYKPL